MEKGNVQKGQFGFDVEVVQQAVLLMDGLRAKNKAVEFCTEEEILNLLDIFRVQRVAAILKLANKEEIHRLIQRSAEEILEFAITLGEKTNRLRWWQEQEKILNTLEDEFKELFVQIQAYVDQQNLQSNLASQIEQANGRVRRSISALLSTEDEANQRKANIQEFYGDLKKRIVDSECDADRKIELVADLEKGLADSLAFVDEKLQEEPTKVYYYKSGSGVAVKVKLSKGGYGYRIGRGKEIRWNRGEDRAEYPMIVSVSYIWDFLCLNDVRDEDILVDPNSVDSYYTYNNKVSANLTPSFVKEWYNYDNPILIRCTPNKHRHTTMLGSPISHFETHLIESSWSDCYVDESITDEEVKKLTSPHEGSYITKRMHDVLKARKAKEAGELEELKSFVKAFDERVQKVIDDHKEEVFNFLEAEFARFVVYAATGTDGASQGFRINENVFGLDSGDTYIKTKNADYTEKRDILRSGDRNEAYWMNVHMPYASQSLTVQRKQFEKVSEIVQRETGIEIYAHFKLD